VPRDREGTFQTALFQRYQHAQKFLRAEKAFVLTLMQMVVEGVSTRRVKDITTELEPPGQRGRSGPRGPCHSPNKYRPLSQPEENLQTTQFEIRTYLRSPVSIEHFQLTSPVSTVYSGSQII
jgi:hypothetical protein